MVNIYSCMETHKLKKRVIEHLDEGKKERKRELVLLQTLIM